MRILMLASEALPFAKTGGLADVLASLPRALARLGQAVDVVIPKYRGIASGSAAPPVEVWHDGRATVVPLWRVEADGVRTFLVDHPPSFDRDGLYGVGVHDYGDNPARFALLARAAAALVRRDRYDVVHAHDWQGGLLPVLLATDGGRPRPGTVFTIHNLAYQGVVDRDWAPRLALPAEVTGINGLEYWGRLSFLKGGIVFSRVITTVSPRYATEIQQPDLGFGFEGILAGRSADLVGILNGIDYDQWDPLRDRYLPEPFDASSLEGKTAAKRALLERYGFPTDDLHMERPLVGMVSRLVDQKGFDLMAAIADDLPRLDATFILLGSGERRYEDLWSDLAARYPGRIGARIGFDEGLAHLIEGGADLFLMPSRFEPCGLNQMYSLRYGTVPVVRATGGLRDTVIPFDPATGGGTGFRFEEYTPLALLETLRTALDVYRRRPVWRRLQQAGMAGDFSWDRSAREYLAVYERALAAN